MLISQNHWCRSESNAAVSIAMDSKLEPRTSITLPIVFHILWNKSSENISDSLVRRQLERLNLDFNYTGSIQSIIPKEFRSSIGYPSIRFCLAIKDPDGMQTSGITRTFTSYQNIGTLKDNSGNYIIHYQSKGGVTPWDQSKYINIWIAKTENLYGRSSIGGQIKIPAEDGIVIDPITVSGDLSKGLLGRTLTHEMGHYLGLKHLWGQKSGECEEDDGIEDTPPQAAPHFGCPEFPQKSCESNSMYMNYMDFTDDACMHIFTKGQVAQMQNILLSQRTGLVSNENTDCQNKLVLTSINEIQYSVRRNTILLQSRQMISDPLPYMICSISGQIIHQGQFFISTQSEIIIKDLPSGIYFLYFRYNKEHKVVKFFKA